MYIVITVRFSQSSYSVNEDFGIVQPVLVLSNPSSFIETVRVTIANISANGMLSSHTYIQTYHIASSYGPGLYFFPATFHPGH